MTPYVVLSPQSRSFPWFRLQRGVFIDQAQGFRDGAFQLGIAIVSIVLWRNIDFDIGVGAVVLDLPAHVFEPESEFRLSGHRTIDQFMARIDANDATPGTLADERAQAKQFEAVGKDVAVRSRLLVGEGNN